MPNQATAVVDSMIAALLAGDLDGMTVNFHPEITLREADCLPYPGVFTGIKAFREDLLGKLLAGLDLEVEEREVLDASNGIVVVRMCGKFTSKHTGRSVQMPMVEIYQVVDGKIVDVDIYYKDAAAISKLYWEG